jgi:hypothetical protein
MQANAVSLPVSAEMGGGQSRSERLEWPESPLASPGVPAIQRCAILRPDVYCEARDAQ